MVSVVSEVCVFRVVSFSPPDDHPDRLAHRNQLLLGGGGTQLLREEGGVGSGQAEGGGRLSRQVGPPTSEPLTGNLLAVAVRPPRVLRGQARHLAGEEISEEEFAGQQTAARPAAKGNAGQGPPSRRSAIFARTMADVNTTEEDSSFHPEGPSLVLMDAHTPYRRTLEPSGQLCVC